MSFANFFAKEVSRGIAKSPRDKNFSTDKGTDEKSIFLWLFIIAILLVIFL